jgi:hypothetical protein
MDAMLRNATLSDRAGVVAALAPLWDDLYLLIPVYQALVAVLTRYGWWSTAKTKDRAYVERSDWFWRPVMIAYNAAMAVFSLVCAVAMGFVVFVRYEGRWRSQDCSLISHDPLFRQVVYAFYISKFVEFADTLFLIVKGKQVSWLHWFHHSGAALNMGLLYHSSMEAAFLFVCLNGVIHTFMYAYYASSLLGIRLPGKSALTSLQIAQFFTGFFLFFSYKDLPCFANSAELMVVYLYTWAYVGTVLLFFCHFFIVNYLVARGAKAGRDRRDKRD